MAQALHSPQRYRGFVLTAVGLQKLHQQIRQLEAKTQLRQSPRTIAERVQLSEPDGIHPITVRKILNGASGVDKRSIQIVFQVLQLQLKEGDYAHAGLYQQSTASQPVTEAAVVIAPPVVATPAVKHQDYSEALERANLYGREHELTDLVKIIGSERCRLVQILGMAGVGKTALTTLVTKAVQPEFEFVVWKSLYHAPAPQAVLTSLLQFLTQPAASSIKLPTQTEALQELLIEQLQNHRCLLIFDRFDSVLSGKQYAGYCRQGFAAYGELLRAVAEVSHQSCLIITSREKPRAIEFEQARYVSSLQLKGLPLLECQQIAKSYERVIGNIDEWRSLTERCEGNPLALKKILACIQDYFNGRISDYLKYLKQGRLLFGDLYDLLSQQFDCLSTVERELVYCLARYLEPISISKLREDMASSLSHLYWLEGLDSLSRRSLLHQQKGYLRLDTMMRTYVNECQLEQRDQASFKPKLEIVSSKHTVA
ncbi:MAG: NACHT domain-containing protein [Leptolyngbyaceae cyanobacterium SL_1_1]|nr:NACHT domain-containing protein [Leptolyngbyaceae cyanobacterium RM1_1_2]NJO10707.1 NACHT domain-containing protein [Leptolyngbyaceae cyanobacterium SL_1_1]